MSCLIATVVLECILQAADVAHMMQHWQTYTKFNQKLHAERLAARDQVPDDTDSHSTTVELWYQGELQFFDSTVLPLTDRLQHCGVFGSYSSEFQNWAHQNRQAWQAQGKALVQQWEQELVKQREPASTNRTGNKPQTMAALFPVRRTVSSPQSPIRQGMQRPPSHPQPPPPAAYASL